ncbi:hypothetical protein F53441_8437 [Fusarium austroafricanum]|uniref:Aminoglycoside phosphotransferase domain-containing protein n=1 Tax=Fusarium austroafricanum TaxID=2364996 RepID=A0A8H4KE16_9HYPO|nr:hypothetical protein F53441_8437 [Fusarium austroafricanum]
MSASSDSGLNDDSIIGSDAGSDDGSVAESEIDPIVFGHLATIPDSSIIALASRIARDVLYASTGNITLAKRVCGSYNIVHIVQLETFKLVIRVPASGWGAGMTKIAADALESQVATMSFVRQQTGVPIPEVYSWDTTNNNEISAPFICMSFLPGENVSNVWFEDSSGVEAREELRLNILTSLSATMAKFSSMSFEKIGSIMQAENGKAVLGPVFGWEDNDDGSVRVEATRTYFSAVEYLACNMEAKAKENGLDRALTKLTKTLLQHSAFLDSDSDSHFVLCPPDFDSQNVLVDDKGNVTGIIDWDHCQTVPPRLGYAAYPGWLTRDWDPIMYGWPDITDFEDSPDALQRYRSHYNKELGKALSWKGDWELTENSHVNEAIWIAALSPMNRLEICRKFVGLALRLDKEDVLDILWEIGEGVYGQEEWDALEDKLKEMVSQSTTLQHTL